MGDYSKERRLYALKESMDGCKLCSLQHYRNNMVWWRGNVNAKMMLIGEAPGEKEDETGIPFVGNAGKMLDKVFENATGEDINEVALITNLVLCRPPNNRVPEIEEVKACRNRLFAMIKVLEPKIVVLLGSTASKRIAGVQPITRWRGDTVDAGMMNEKKRMITFTTMPTYHPSYLLRSRNPQHQKDMEKDIANAWECIDVEQI